MAKKNKDQYPRYPLVVVTWIDSTYHQTGWQPADQAQEWARGPVATCKTAGFLIHRDKHGLTVALSISSNGNVADFLKIPHACVKDVQRLRQRKR